jgi:hypothetical protein
MPIALLVTLIGMSLSALMVPMVIVQLRTTGNADRSATALHAAQAGLDVALGHLRAARDPATGGGPAPDVGRRDQLPCGPLTGEAGGGRYAVEIEYLAADPADLLSAADPYTAVTTSSQRIGTCVSGSGLSTTPAFAVLFSWGTGSPGEDARTGSSRRLQAVYQFRTTNANISGGAIRVETSTGGQLCMDATAAQPAENTEVVMQPCQDRSARQTFAYNQNLTLTLTSSRTPARPLGMCLDADVPHAVGILIVLRACAATTQPSQQWSINDAANFVGTTDGTTLDGFCFTVRNPDTPGSLVELAKDYPNCNAGYDNKQTFQPDASVGAGAAGPASGQLVNFKQFGRCLDVTNLNPNSSYLIAWPCKQAPDPSTIAWNQRWQYPPVVEDLAQPGTFHGTGTIVTTRGGTDYCLQSPDSAIFGDYPRIVECPSGTPPPNLVWTVYGKMATYVTSYRVRVGPHTAGSEGLCLAAADPKAPSPELYEDAGYAGRSISKIVLRSCDRSTLQKWNAPADLLDSSPLKGFAEK